MLDQQFDALLPHPNAPCIKHALKSNFCSRDQYFRKSLDDHMPI